MNKLISTLYMIAFFVIIFGFSIASLAAPHKDISAVENRRLGKLPDLSIETVASRRFFEDMNQYANDRIVLRNEMVTLYQQQQNSKMFNSVLLDNLFHAEKPIRPEDGTEIIDSRQVSKLVVTNNKWILPMTDKVIHTSEIDNATKHLNDAVRFAESQHIETYFVSNPSRTKALMHLYPKYLQTDAYAKSKAYFLSKLDKHIPVIDVGKKFDSFTNADLEELYLETDHHWNIKGAFTGYEELIAELSKMSPKFEGKPLSMSELHVSTLTSGAFEGSYNAQIHDAVDPEKADRTKIYEPKIPFTFVNFEAVSVDGKRTITAFDDFYGFKKGQPMYSYGTIYGGDKRKITYENPKANNRLHVLLIKDSFMNPITPYLAQNFYKLTVLDNRYDPEFSLKKVVTSEHYDILLIAFHDDNLYSESYTFEKNNSK